MSPQLAAQLKVVQSPVRDLDGVMVGIVEEDGYGLFRASCAECLWNGPILRPVLTAEQDMYAHAAARHGART